MKIVSDMAKKLFCYFLLVASVVGFHSCEQPREPRDLHNDLFNWSIDIPDSFEKVNSKELEQLKAKGRDALEDSFSENIEDKSTTIFTFKKGELNYMESNYQPYDTGVDGSYLHSTREVNKTLYTTFQEQMPGMQIDSSSSIEKISELEFQAFTLTITFPNNVSLNSKMYSRLFNDKELTVNIMYVDSLAGAEMINVWQNSIF